MSKPFVKYEDPARGAQLEIQSALSALHMHPDPITPDPDGPGYLTDCDAWAKHAEEHLRAALRQAVAAELEIERLKNRIYRLGLRAAEQRAKAPAKHECHEDNQGLCHGCGVVMNADRYLEYFGKLPVVCRYCERAIQGDPDSHICP
jgi:hypothetical protein